MKRITKLEISNFRAFFDDYKIELPKGENLLVYGENGSGKSSLFKSLTNFLSSSQNAGFPYVKHHKKISSTGLLTFTFTEYDHLTNSILPSSANALKFGSNIVTTNTEQFLKVAELTKGFLDYKGLLSVYNHNEAQPNLFQLIILNLFKDFIPTHLGGTTSLGSEFIHLNKEILEAYTRNTWRYRDAIDDIENYEILLRKVLDEVFIQLNYFLIKYFKLNLRVRYSLTPLIAIDWWRIIPQELKLELSLNSEIVHHQSDFLNEARLSALAICLYLAIIKKNPVAIDFKVLFLDDVFIGLDLTNRLPILDIIKNEFSEHQVFISTYDRHLYELAKRKFEIETPDKWKNIELYVGTDTIGSTSVERPILVFGESHFEKAIQYLHNRTKPDYPASANYFRKALEQLIQDFIPKWETADAENTQIPDYQLTQLILRTKRFLNNANHSTKNVDDILALLSSLLHPLSHHEITSPIYRGELLIIENSFQKLMEQLSSLDIANNYKCCLESGTRLKMTFEISSATNHFCYYDLSLRSPLTMKKNGISMPIISKVHCVAEKFYGHNGTSQYPSGNPNKKSADFNYDSLESAYDTIHNYLSNNSSIGQFPKVADYLTTIEYHNGSNWEVLTNRIVVW